MKYLIGIDEVGRGALAGPVVVAALAVPQNRRFRREIKDSKSLTRPAREKLAKWAKDTGLNYTIARVYPNVVDRINITKAADLAAQRALNRLFRNDGIAISAAIYLDGGLYIRSKNYQKRQGFKARTVVRGDQKFVAVRLASVVAKVSRDRYMAKLNRVHPGYGFHVHKGYGTREHREALRKLGPSKVHRLTFLRKIRSIKKRNGRRTG